jgi:hypothetical protein
MMRAQFKKEILTPPSEEEVQHTLDLVTGFAMPVVKMEHMGLAKAFEGKGPAVTTGARDMVRKLVSEANQNPEIGPQNLATRVEAIKYAAGLPSKVEQQWNRLADSHVSGELSFKEWYEARKPFRTAMDWGASLLHALEGKAAKSRVLKVVGSEAEKPLGWEPSLQRTARKVEDVYE